MMADEEMFDPILLLNERLSRTNNKRRNPDIIFFIRDYGRIHAPQSQSRTIIQDKIMFPNKLFRPKFATKLERERVVIVQWSKQHFGRFFIIEQIHPQSLVQRGCRTVT